jgi:hypothetical protein
MNPQMKYGKMLIQDDPHHYLAITFYSVKLFREGKVDKCINEWKYERPIRKLLGDSNDETSWVDCRME